MANAQESLAQISGAGIARWAPGYLHCDGLLSNLAKLLLKLLTDERQRAAAWLSWRKQA